MCVDRRWEWGHVELDYIIVLECVWLLYRQSMDVFWFVNIHAINTDDDCAITSVI